MRTVRSEIMAKLKQYGDPQADYIACELTIGELIANAIMHAPPGDVSISLDWSAAKPLMRVTDDGPGFTPVARMPDPTVPGGRGLYIVSKLAGDVSVDVHPVDGCTVAVELPVTKRRRFVP